MMRGGFMRRGDRRAAREASTEARAPSVATPIYISRRTRGILIAVAAVLSLLLLYRAPSILMLSLGGFALALVMSFPVRWLARFMARGFAIALSLLGVLAALVLVIAGVVPVVLDQLSALIEAAPGIAQRIGERVPSLLAGLADRGLLPQSPERFIATMRAEALEGVQSFAGRLLGGLGGFLSRVVGLAVTLFGIVFVAVYLLVDSRRIKAATLLVTPHMYRHDVRELWEAFGVTLSRYLGGLGLSLAIQGVISAVALLVIGVPYAILLGAWVSVTGVIPYLGAWLGGIPAVLLALSVSPTRAILTGVLFFLIQQLEGNVLTPRIQGEAVRVHPVLIFLAVIAGGEMFGLMGIVFAVPVLAVLRVLAEFLSVRLRTVDTTRAAVVVADG